MRVTQHQIRILLSPDYLEGFVQLICDLTTKKSKTLLIISKTLFFLLLLSLIKILSDRPCTLGWSHSIARATQTKFSHFWYAKKTNCQTGSEAIVQQWLDLLTPNLVHLLRSVSSVFLFIIISCFTINSEKCDDWQFNAVEL